MRRYLATIVLLAAILTSPVDGAPWVRSYVVTNYEPAWYYGSNTTFRKSNFIEPGSDCPKGTHQDLDYDAILKTPWRTKADIDAINRPPNTDIYTIEYIQERGLTFRGFRDGIDVYINPFSAPDPGIQEVTGRIAEGFNLDGSAGTGGFTSPEGEKGIDNAYYRAFGCALSFRGIPYHAALSARANAQMIEGLYTMVIRVSGTKDPMNDDNATVEIGYSPDHVVKGANDTFLPDYSFRMAQTSEYSKTRATVRNGVVETEQVKELHAPRFSWYPNQYGDADFHSGILRLTVNSKGDISGLIGGYRDWRDMFSEDNFTQNGSILEQREHQDSIALYYALKRNADGIFDQQTRQHLGISVAYRFRAQPAFVVDPVTSAQSAISLFLKTPSLKRSIYMYREHRAAFYKALATRKIQPIPVISTEAAQAFIERGSDGRWQLIGSKANARPASETQEQAPPSETVYRDKSQTAAVRP